MKVVTVAEMKNIEKAAIEEYGIPGIILMENAGVEVVRQMESILGNLHNKKISVLAGTGNNGGDGYVVARHLHNQGAKVKVFLIGGKAAVQGDALTNLQIIIHMGIDILEVENQHDWDKVKIAMTFTDCLVDALVGTGFTGQLRDNMTQVVKCINKMNKVIIAIDIPTGVDGDTGQIQGVAVKASHTITFALPKQGLLLYPGASYVGELYVADIGIPKSLLQDRSIQQNLITSLEAEAMFVKRQPDVHKGSCGKVLVVAGSKGLTGAAALSANAAMRSGAGTVTLGIAESLHDIMEMKLTEVMTKPLAETTSGFLGEESYTEIERLSLQNDVVAIGPGLGRQVETLSLVRRVIQRTERPLVIDADALYALIDHTSILTEAKSVAILTPHAGEMARLVGLTPEEVNQDRIFIARQAAIEWESIIILKGARTVVAFPDGEVYINSSGNAGMATGGTGDVLTGVIAGLIGQGLSSHEAALTGVYIHGLAGDIVARSGMIGIIASDIIKALPAAIFGIQEKD